jgi:DNA-binding NarL/FixJ family response regulator
MNENQAIHRARVVLADDHEVVRAGLSNALKDLPGVEIVGEVGDGPSVFAVLAREQPDCLLLDVTMPQFDPIAAIRQIRASYPALKILVVSAYADDSYVQGLLGVGVDGYHLKDQPLSDLRLAVQRVLDGGRWISGPLVEKLVRRTGPSSPAEPPLTGRQRDMLCLLLQGLDNQAIAREMGLSIKTVENHLTRLYRQLGVQSRLEAVSYATRHAAGLDLAEPTHTAPTGRRGQAAILLVDDNPRYRGQLRRVIGHSFPQLQIHEAATVAEAAHLAQQTAPQLALIDVVLGDEDGITCTRRIRALCPTTRIVLISAYPDREFHRLGMEAGAVAFLDKKDLDAAALRELVEDAIDVEKS